MEENKNEIPETKRTRNCSYFLWEFMLLSFFSLPFHTQLLYFLPSIFRSSESFKSSQRLRLFTIYLIFPSYLHFAKGMHKGTSEAPVLSESKREHRSKRLSLWGEGKRKRFPLQPFAGDLFVVYLATKKPRMPFTDNFLVSYHLYLSRKRFA